MSTKKVEFLELLAVISANYEKVVDPDIQNLHWNSLKGYKIDEIKLAFQKHLEDPDQGRFSPKVAHLMKFLKPDDKSEAINAFSLVMEAARSRGFNNKPKFHPLIERVVRNMTWKAFCFVHNDNIAFLEKRFIEHYQAAKDARLLPEDLLTYEEPRGNGFPKRITSVLVDKDAANDDDDADDNDDKDEDEDEVLG